MERVFTRSYSNRFESCVPSEIGSFSLISPADYVTLAPPFTLTWNLPNSLGDGCTGSGLPQYELYLSQSYPPTMLDLLDENSTSYIIDSIGSGVWYWTVKAVNSYFYTWATDTFELTVLNSEFTHLLVQGLHIRTP